MRRSWVSWRIAGLILTVLMHHPVLAAEGRYAWQNVTMDAGFAGRDGAGALVFQDRMWLLGGWNPQDKAAFPKICSNDVWSSTDGASWTQVKPNTFRDGVYDPATDWEGRHAAGYVVYDGKMWIVGGDPNQGHYQNDIWNSSDGAHWTRITDSPPWGPRFLMHVLVHDGRMWLLGGQTVPQFIPGETAAAAHHNDVWNSTDGGNWTRVETRGEVWTPRGGIAGSVVFKDRMWVIGGGTYWTPNTPQVLYNDVWSSADGVEWTRETAEAPWAARKFHSVAVFDNRMWVVAGATLENLSDVWYSDDGVNWTELPGTPWQARHAASVFVYDDALWMVAGDCLVPDVWRLTRAGDEPEPDSGD